jgi:hypothetical protein
VNAASDILELPNTETAGLVNHSTIINSHRATTDDCHVSPEDMLAHE